jgi:hypothetical protein
LDIIKPTQSQIRQFLVERPSTLSPRFKWVYFDWKYRN